MKTAVTCIDRNIVDTRFAATHQSFFVELPKLVPVRAVPLAAGSAILILKPHGDSIVAERPQRFGQTVVEFVFPFCCQERTDFFTTSQKPVAVSPLRVGRVGK